LRTIWHILGLNLCLGLGLSLEAQILGLGLEAQVLGLSLEAKVFGLVLLLYVLDSNTGHYMVIAVRICS